MFIMPGMENFAPERTLSSSGFVGSPSFLPSSLLELRQRLPDLLVHFGRNLPVVVEVDVADLGRDREAGRHRHARVAHLGEAGALAAERVFHVLVTVGSVAAERVNVFLTH